MVHCPTIRQNCHIHSQPLTRGELSSMFGKEVSRDTIASLRDAGFLGSGPRSPTPGAPYTYVTTRHFLSVFSLETLRELPDLERFEDAGLLNRQRFGGMHLLKMRDRKGPECRIYLGAQVFDLPHRLGRRRRPPSITRAGARRHRCLERTAGAALQHPPPAPIR